MSAHLLFGLGMLVAGLVLVVPRIASDRRGERPSILGRLAPGLIGVALAWVVSDLFGFPGGALLAIGVVAVVVVLYGRRRLRKA